MGSTEKPARRYRLSDDVAAQPPNFDRAVRVLSDEELEDEIRLGRGEPDYQLALLAEFERRAKETE